MLLYLVQHAESKSKQDDPERHLSEKGVREAEAVAAFLRPLGLGVREIWNSGKARAAETAEILARVVKSDHGVRERDGLAPNDSIRPVREQLLERTGDLMIVGHLPFLDNLASQLLADAKDAAIVGFRKSAVLCLEWDPKGGWRIRWMIAPELVGVQGG